MPKRNDIKKVMIIGAGPIVIGQGCEFDYSGVQACKALKNEGYEIVLVNSNPATIMTDPEFADRTYIEPLSADILHEIIRRERPDAILPTLGGQTALNLAVELYDKGILKRYGVEMIGASVKSINKAEDRQLFKKTMKEIGLDLPRSGSAHTMQEAVAVAEAIGTWPLIIRPGFTLGGTGGGIAHNKEEFHQIVTRGLFESRNSEVLIEESLLGWKEYEMEVMRDKKNNAVIVCSIENFDPMGVHTGDSITVAPIQTLTDREYQAMRDDSLRVMQAIGVETGGANVQWAVNPKDGRRIVIEMNPRVSRSSALASKATGFPIAKIAALLAVGYTLDELINDITGETPACFEPALDYIVTKIPRFTFEKFQKADSTLGTQMKSVGEAMAIGKTFKQSFQKALRSLEIGRSGFGSDGKDEPYEKMTDEELNVALQVPKADRVFALRAAFKRGYSIDTVYEHSKIDKYFLRHLQEITAFEDEIKSAGSLDNLSKDRELFIQAKEFGFSDKQIAFLLQVTEKDVRDKRKEVNIAPSYAAVDTCAGEFYAKTPYYYSSYSEYSEPARLDNNRKSIMVLGGGPNRIGQGIEFDYCCVHASFALKMAGYDCIMVNSNPETVSTDYDISDKLYFEPLTIEDVLHIYEREQCVGAIVQFGGQTPLNLARELENCGVKIIGTNPDSIEFAEDRDRFQKLINKLNIKQPENGIAYKEQEALDIADRIGYPVLVRPSFVLGGRGMVIAYTRETLEKYIKYAVQLSNDNPILIDKFLNDAVEVDVDCISDGNTTVIGGIMEHVEPAGIHSGDSAAVIPTMTLSKEILDTIRSHTFALAKELNVCGLMNIQYAVHNNQVYIIEANPRASRTAPFVSKSIGAPLVKYAVRCMLGETLSQIGFTEEIIPPYTTVKEAVFPFSKFIGADIFLSPEMHSTGEVMGMDTSKGLAYLKSQIAAGGKLPESGNIFVSLNNRDKERAVPYLKDLAELGFNIYATEGTSTMLYDNNIKSNAIFKISKGRPNLVDLLNEDKIQWIIMTREDGEDAITDEIKTRSIAILKGVPMTSTFSGIAAAVDGLKEKADFGRFEVYSLQEYHRKIKLKHK